MSGGDIHTGNGTKNPFAESSRVDRGTFRQQVHSLDDREFERFTCDFFDLRGWETELTQPTRDGGYDVYLERTGHTQIVQAKHSEKVGPRDIKAAAGCALEHDTQEVAVVALSFTSGAKSAAEDITKNSHLTIDLYSLTDIHRSLRKMERQISLRSMQQILHLLLQSSSKTGRQYPVKQINPGDRRFS